MGRILLEAMGMKVKKFYAQIKSRQQFRHAVMMRTADVAVCIEDEAGDAA